MRYLSACLDRLRYGRNRRLNFFVDTAALEEDVLVCTGWALARGQAVTLQIGAQRYELAGSDVVLFARQDVAAHFGVACDDVIGFAALLRLERACGMPLSIRAEAAGKGASREVFRNATSEELAAALRALPGRARMEWLRHQVHRQQKLPAVLYEALAKIGCGEERIKVALDFWSTANAERAVTSGWVTSPRAQETQLYLQSRRGTAHRLERLVRFPRPDLAVCVSGCDFSNAGFHAVIPSRVADEKTVRHAVIETPTDMAVFPVAPAFDAIDRHLEQISYTVKLQDGVYTWFLEEGIHPLLERKHCRKPAIEGITCRDFGDVPSQPMATVIVPLYRRYDFVEYQLAMFDADPTFRGAELIYVVDDPTIYEAVIALARDCARVYRQPFRVLYAGMNLGFAGANNLGASHAKSPLLLFLNSDVFPKRAGWLTDLVEAYSRLPRAGVIGPRLLYEDDSIQHAGMSFTQDLHAADLWWNVHPRKGFPAAFDPAAGPIEVPAVTGACFFLAADLYRQLGGWDEGYVRGDFEDSDLCLKAIQAGRVNYYVPGIELYHLEAQSFNRGEGSGNLLALSNCRRHARRWGEMLKRYAS